MTRTSFHEVETPVLPSSLYVTHSLPRCNCGDRWQCDQCRRAWIGRRYRASKKWLRERINLDGEIWFALLTIPTGKEWLGETAELFERWSKLGKARSQQRFRKQRGQLGAIRRGIAVLHLLRRDGNYHPHLHAVIVSNANMDFQSVIDAWQAMGQGFADLQKADSLEATIRYSIADDVPNDPLERQSLASLLKGVRMVRRIGK